ncbi:hypothetical protein NL676_027435 [Syzygium grande]|nr:hypothetical protein NL676_027435 [Syzygium grande]
MNQEAEEELKNFILVWTSALAALAYSYFASSAVPRGALRLLSLLPAVLLLSFLPLRLSSFHLGGPTVFFLVKPPREDKKAPGKSPKAALASVRLAVKVFILVSVLRAYEYRPRLHEYAILALYCVHMYLELELVLAICAVPASAALGLDLERQFDEPYLATSLQDFWGRRWNLMVSSILRSTVYDPVRRRLAPLVGARPASLPATVAAFAVSGVMHEAIYYYITRARPTWEVTWFFVFHGNCVAAEVAAKRWVGGRWRMHRAASGVLTVAFVAVTGVRWFFPQLTRNGVDEKVIRECYAMFDFVKCEVTRLVFHIKSGFVSGCPSATMMMEGRSLWEAVAQGWGRLELRDREEGGRGRAYGAREGGPTGWGVMDLLKRQWINLWVKDLFTDGWTKSQRECISIPFVWTAWILHLRVILPIANRSFGNPKGIFSQRDRNQLVFCNSGPSTNLFLITLVITATVCCWMMWAIVYLAQMKPLIVPILSDGE